MFLNKNIMPYAIYYPSGCATSIPNHYCDACPTPEHARLRGAAFIANDFEFNDPSDPNEWEDGIANKKIIVIPETNGSFDGGSEVETAGYGDQQTKLTGYNFQATYNDPNYKLNADFYNAIKNSRNYKFAYRTESLVHLTRNTVQVIPKNPVAEDVTGEVIWNVLVKWSEGDLPVPYDLPHGIFTCFDYTGAII
jgi:hypothetical protein